MLLHDTKVECPICKTTKVRQTRDRKKLTHYQCRVCRVAFTCYKDKQENEALENESSTSSNEWFTTGMFDIHHACCEMGMSFSKNRMTMYRELTQKSDLSVLEVGCGDGKLYPGFAAAGASWKGIEINEHAVEFAKAQGYPVLFQDFLTMDEGETFDVIFASQVVEHILDPHAFFTKAWRLLKPGGILHVDVPNHHGLLCTLARKFYPFTNDYGMLQPPFHLRAYSKVSLRYLFEQHQFTPLIIDAFRNDHPTYGQVSPAINLFYNKIMYLCSELARSASLLVGVAQKNDDNEST